MNNIKEFLEIEAERIAVQDKIFPLKQRLDTLSAKVNVLSDGLTLKEKEFINLKLWENFSEVRQAEVLKARHERDLEWNNNVYSARVTPFDPYRDSWHLITFKKCDDNKIALEVSCNKNEGSISGLMTFLDTYWTVPFDPEEIDVYNSK